MPPIKGLVIIVMPSIAKPSHKLAIFSYLKTAFCRSTSYKKGEI